MFPVDKNTNSRLDISGPSCYIELGSGEDRNKGASFFVPRHGHSYTLVSKEPSSTAGSVSWQHAHGPHQTPHSSLAFYVRSVRAMTPNITTTPTVPLLAVRYA